MFDREALRDELLAEHIGDAARAIVVVAHRFQHAHGLAVVAEPELDRRMRERDRLDELVDVAELGALGAQELAPRGHVVEEIAHVDLRAARVLRRRRSARLAAVDLDAPRVVGVGEPRSQREARHRCDRRQRLAAKAERADAFEILERGDLARRMRGDRERKVIRLDAGAVVAHADQPRAAGFDIDLDAPSAGIEAVLDELLDDRRRPFDDLAGGDLVDELGGQLTDARHGGDVRAEPHDSRRASPLIAVSRLRERPRSGRGCRVGFAKRSGLRCAHPPLIAATLLPRAAR